MRNVFNRFIRNISYRLFCPIFHKVYFDVLLIKNCKSKNVKSRMRKMHLFYLFEDYVFHVWGYSTLFDIRTL